MEGVKTSLALEWHHDVIAYSSLQSTYISSTFSDWFVENIDFLSLVNVLFADKSAIGAEIFLLWTLLECFLIGLTDSLCLAAEWSNKQCVLPKSVQLVSESMLFSLDWVRFVYKLWLTEGQQNELRFTITQSETELMDFESASCTVNFQWICHRMYSLLLNSHATKSITFLYINDVHMRFCFFNLLGVWIWISVSICRHFK